MGLSPEALARVLLDEAVLALLIDGHDETGIHALLDDVVTTTAVPWLGQLRHKSGMCDCVAEVHFEAKCEADLARRTG